jgi:acyl-CoA thioesterase
MSNLSEIIHALARDGDAWHVNPSDDWRQGRTLFGGLSAALCYAACERLVSGLPPLRSAQFAYVGPSAGESVLVPSVLRRGKSVTFMACDQLSEGAVATRALFCFGGERESAHQQEPAAAPEVPPPDDCPPLFGERRPAFTTHLDQRLAGGGRPVSGAANGDMLVWVRHVDPNPPASLASLIALGDALPPASMPRLTEPAAISTMTWHFDLVDPARFVPAGWHLLRSTDDALGHGYAGQAMGMWDAQGRAVLIGRQSVAVFA